jgi:hypothetical protein
MDELLRENSRVAIGDTATIKKITVRNAENSL